MRLRDPRLWFGGASLGLVLGLFALDFERTSPGPLSAPHAAIADLAGADGCAQCHGGWFSSMFDACLECHEEIERQLEHGGGLHGAHLPTALTEIEARRCGACHSEHHGAELELSGVAAFRKAGFADPADFDHPHVAFALGGRHDELGCVECHANAEAEVLREGQARFLGLDQRCTSCHEDPHEGRFTRSCDSCHGQEQPFGELASFVHGEAFPLLGGHARSSCKDCHEPGSAHEVEALAGRGPPPPARACEDCHASPHREEFTASAGLLLDGPEGATCAACHDAERGPFAEDDDLSDLGLHAASGFTLDAPHDAAACADCHAADVTTAKALLALSRPSAEAPADFVARFPGRQADDCAACHDDPHTEQFDVAAWAAEGCLACHDRHAFDPPRFGVADHARTAFPLDGAHAAVACATCHSEPAAPAQGPRVFHGTPTGCVACHAQTHGSSLGGAFAQPAGSAPPGGAPAAAQDCDACHAPTTFAEVDREAFDHRAWTAFELDGAHARADCAACHPRAGEPEPDGRTFGRAAQAFAGPLDRCATCHADVHRGFFDDPRFAVEREGLEGCARCHVTEGFREGPVAGFDHGAWTGFVLDGAHAETTCLRCHGEALAAAADPSTPARGFGLVRERVVQGAEGCAACHEDPHAGRFDTPGERASCAACHTTTSFAEVLREAFEHERWSGFALAGEHARASCESCHAPGRGRSEGMLHLGRARGTDCAACHVDPHVGQFARDGRTDCAACHAVDAPDFRRLDFDHQRDARFALDERHRDLACSACHVPWPLKSGEKVVRYKPLGIECIDCHDHGGKQGGRRSRSRGGDR